jgi:hypothetical protein
MTAALVAAVQANCHRADARHAGELTLCTYLLQMREFFRWERGLPLTATLPRGDVGSWIAAREALWERLVDEPYAALPTDDATLDPFEADALNLRLQAQGWLYGAGRLGGQDGGRPVFFLAERHAQGQRDGMTVLQAGRELARGLLAPPAVLAGGGAGPIVVRREALARWCWQGYEAWTMRRREGSAWHAVVQAYGLDEGFERALPRWLDDLVEVSVLHELGEHQVGQRLGARWPALRAALPDRRSDLHAVALRDLLADLQRTLPALLARAQAAPLHAWFASFDGVRAALFPRLVAAHAAWRAGQGLEPLHDAVAAGSAHFEALAAQVLALHDDKDPGSAAAVAALLTGASAVCGG